jgi:hypothetical protein
MRIYEVTIPKNATATEVNEVLQPATTHEVVKESSIKNPDFGVIFTFKNKDHHDVCLTTSNETDLKYTLLVNSENAVVFCGLTGALDQVTQSEEWFKITIKTTMDDFEWYTDHYYKRANATLAGHAALVGNFHNERYAPNLAKYKQDRYASWTDSDTFEYKVIHVKIIPYETGEAIYAICDD